MRFATFFKQLLYKMCTLLHRSKPLRNIFLQTFAKFGKFHPEDAVAWDVSEAPAPAAQFLGLGETLVELREFLLIHDS